jgi:hypothetical protein
MPSDAYVHRDAVDFDLMRLHRSREGMDTILMSFIVHRFTLFTPVLLVGA